MVIAIHQPNYFPWPGYFFKILKSDIFVFLDDVQYSNNSFTCRTNILENKNKSWLSVPIKKKMGQNINQILIADLEWKMKHLSKIKNCYLKTEYFSVLWEKINLIYDGLSEVNISEINKAIIITLSEWLGYKTKFLSSSSLNLNNNLRGEDKIIEIIKHFNADIYLSGSGGKNYQENKRFVNEGIKLVYSIYSSEPYKQMPMNKNFIPGLSILDLLFNLGIDSSKYYISKSFLVS